VSGAALPVPRRYWNAVSPARRLCLHLQFALARTTSALRLSGATVRGWNAPEGRAVAGAQRRTGFREWDS
jgi:hypothetical protein